MAALDPILPTASRDHLLNLSSEILRSAGALSAKIPSPIIRTRAALLVREMNSYYSNLIEGHKTKPRDIENALRQDFSDNPERRASQHFARAHIEVEALMFERLSSECSISIHSTDFLRWLHKEFYERLPDNLHFSAHQSGKKYRIQPGALRDFEVSVGLHQPPPADALPQMLARFADAYQSKEKDPSQQLVALAAAHHRLTWIHPFGDGNGRVARLYSHASIARARIDSFGLWTLSRGLARQRSKYFASLAAADQKRWNDLDGRGNLSDRGLSQFCAFFLETILDQIHFMSSLFEFETLSTRIDHHLRFELLQLKPRDRERLSKLLREILIRGEIQRGAVSDIVGLRGTSARDLIRLALNVRLIESATPKGPLTIVFSSDTLDNYFPKLYQDVPAE